MSGEFFPRKIAPRSVCAEKKSLRETAKTHRSPDFGLFPAAPRVSEQESFPPAASEVFDWSDTDQARGTKRTNLEKEGTEIPRWRRKQEGERGILGA